MKSMAESELHRNSRTLSNSRSACAYPDRWPTLRLRDLVILTLRKMAQGGIYDQLGGGFCRYSTDAYWQIPHFEKMLYDNGPLLRLYADAWLVTGEPLFKRICEETAAWVMREMQSAEGGYYSSLDADSEHEEGKFYVWSREEFAALLTEDEYEVAAAFFGIDRAPNFEGRAWNPCVAQPMESVAAKTGRELQQCESLLQSARAKLFAARDKRVHPGRDEKILTSWNALMIEGMTHAARVFGRDDWHASARRAMDFVTATMWKQGTAAGDLQGRPRASERVPGRLCISACCVAGDVAGRV